MGGHHFRRPYGARWIVAALALVMALAATPTVHADEAERIAQLTATLGNGHSERERIAAITALARLGSKTALRPLVTALRDSSPSVRGIAAAGLGKLGHRAALPALRQAQGDGDAVVKKRAAEAIGQICVANNLPVEAAPGAPAVAKTRPGFGNQPRAVAPRPDLYVVIKSSSDDSPGKHDKKARKVHADALREAMTTELASANLVTLTASDAKKFGLDPRQLDLSIVGLEFRQDGAFVEVEAQVRLAISNDNGKMLSFVSGGAKVQVPRRGYDATYLPQLRRDAVENAVRGLFSKVIDQLRRSLTS
ncbi:MAG: HEAT repeat domain-containing protein [Myxococcales bacterium]|nr:HEAT repeat domain-containing protein [Myxococcales bacterium]